VASERDLARIATLRAARVTLSDEGFHSEAEAVRHEIKRLNRPHVGEVLLYGSEPVKVVRVFDVDLVACVPADVVVAFTHQGNLTDAAGKSIYRVCE
jgi:hypothetical protein